MSSLITNAVAEALAEKITRQIMYQLSGEWGTVLSELSKSQKILEGLSRKVYALEKQITLQSDATRRIVLKTESTLHAINENQAQAAKTLRLAMEDLGLTE